MTGRRSLLDRTFRDDDGKLVLGQPPNLPILTWMVATASAWLLPEGNPAEAARLVAYGALFTWGWLELVDGVNWFRRGLGLVVLVGLVASRL